MEITYEEFVAGQFEDQPELIKVLTRIPNFAEAEYINTFGVEYYGIPIKDCLKLIYRDTTKTYLCFKQIQTVKKEQKNKYKDSIAFVKTNADLVIIN